MGRSIVSVLVVATGCSSSGGASVAVPGDGGGSDTGQGIDAGSDAAPDAPTPSSGTLSFVDGPEYASTRDTYLSAEEPDQPHGAVDSVKVEADVPEIGLLRFDDIFGPDAVPPGATITEAILAITVFDASEEDGDGALVEAAVAWTESVTFNDFGGEAGVQQDERHPEVIAALPARFVGRRELDVTDSLERWSAGERANHGWLLLSGNVNDELVRSSEYADAPAERPTLIVSYTVP